jgi:carbon-monoxide dehydrogenase medium subunit
VWFPAVPATTGTAFVELSRRHGDYALCGVGATVTLDATGAVAAAQAVYLSVAPVPLVVDLTEAVGGAGRGGSRAHGNGSAGLDVGAAARLARDRVEPDDDIHATAAYRRHLAGVLTERAVRQAADRAHPTGELLG